MEVLGGLEGLVLVRSLYTPRGTRPRRILSNINRKAIENLSKIYRKPIENLTEIYRNPPRPLASRRVEVWTKQQTLQTSQNLQTILLGGGFTLRLPPPRRYGSPGRFFSELPRGTLDPSKSSSKTNAFLICSLFGPTKPAHIPFTCAI